MNGKFTHYLITRFNVPVKNWERDKTGKVVLDDLWMQHRLELFRRYCVPTIAHQLEKNFTWLIYCDSSTPTHLANEIQAAVSEIPAAQIRQVADFEDLLMDLRQLIASDSSPFIITSRVDNDDGLGPQFIQLIQEHAEPHDRLILNFSKGILYDAHQRILTEIRNSHLNHFGSLIEENKAGKVLVTSMGYPHGRPPEGSRIMDIDSRFAWLKIIHDRNMASKTNGMPIRRGKMISHFNLDLDALLQSWPAIAWFIGIRMLSRVKRKIVGIKK